MCEQNASYLVKHSDLGAKNLNKIKNCSKSAKMATTLYTFSKMFRASVPPDPPRSFFIPNMLQNNSAEKSTLKNKANWGAPSLKKVLEYVADMKTFSKGC